MWTGSARKASEGRMDLALQREMTQHSRRGQVHDARLTVILHYPRGMRTQGNSNLDRVVYQVGQIGGDVTRVLQEVGAVIATLNHAGVLRLLETDKNLEAELDVAGVYEAEESQAREAEAYNIFE